MFVPVLANRCFTFLVVITSLLVFVLFSVLSYFFCAFEVAALPLRLDSVATHDYTPDLLSAITLPGHTSLDWFILYRFLFSLDLYI
jgi:hypothetical protein